MRTRLCECVRVLVHVPKIPKIAPKAPQPAPQMIPDANPDPPRQVAFKLNRNGSEDSKAALP